MNPFQHKGRDFEIAYSKYADMLYRLAFSYMTHKEDAEDIVQDVFTKYMCGFHLTMDEEHEKAWFVRVTSPMLLAMNEVAMAVNEKTAAVTVKKREFRILPMGTVAGRFER